MQQALICCLTVMSLGVFASNLPSAKPYQERNGLHLEGDVVEDSFGVFSRTKTVFAVDFARANLTYLPADESPHYATWPEPVFLEPNQGIWLVDPGPDLRSWRLLLFNMNGHPVTRVDLVKKLSLGSPAEFIPCRIFAGSGESVFLLGSSQFDYEADLQKDFFLVEFSSNGRVISQWKLPDFQFDWEALMPTRDLVYNVEKSNQTAAWHTYRLGGGKEILVETSLLNKWIDIEGQILERLSSREFQMLGKGGEVKKISLWGAGVPNGVPVCGEGRIFGFVKESFGDEDDQEDESMEDNEQVDEDDFDLEDEREQEGNDEKDTNDIRALESEPIIIIRDLVLCYFNKANLTIHNISRVELPPIELSKNYPEEFIYYRTKQSRFDVNGNLFEIAWSPTELYVYQHVLNPSLIDG